MVQTLWGPAYKGLGGYFRKMGELAISPANYPFLIGAVSAFAILAAIPVTDKDLKESSQNTHTHLLHSALSTRSYTLHSTPLHSTPRVSSSRSMVARRARMYVCMYVCMYARSSTIRCCHSLTVCPVVCLLALALAL